MTERMSRSTSRGYPLQKLVLPGKSRELQFLWQRGGQSFFRVLKNWQFEFRYRRHLKHALTKVRVAAADVHPSDCADHPKWPALTFGQMQARRKSSRTNDMAAVNKVMF